VEELIKKIEKISSRISARYIINHAMVALSEIESMQCIAYREKAYTYVNLILLCLFDRVIRNIILTGLQLYDLDRDSFDQICNIQMQSYA